MYVYLDLEMSARCTLTFSGVMRYEKGLHVCMVLFVLFALKNSHNL